MQKLLVCSILEEKIGNEMQKESGMVCELCGKENLNIHQDFCTYLGCSGRMIKRNEEIMDTMYYCYFLFYDKLQCTHAKNISVFQKGFWVGIDFNYTNGSDCVYWIPPTKIEYIKKGI